MIKAKGIEKEARADYDQGETRETGGLTTCACRLLQVRKLSKITSSGDYKLAAKLLLNPNRLLPPLFRALEAVENVERGVQLFSREIKKNETALHSMSHGMRPATLSPLTWPVIAKPIARKPAESFIPS
jgi:hypothetical protein